MSGGVAAKTLREEGYAGRIVLIGHEPTPPFGRPPLSKTYLRGEETLSGWLVKPESWYEENHVERVNATATRVDISSQQLRTWRPLGPNKTEMTSHCLAPIGEGDAAREMRIRNYEDFFNPTGLGSSDDNLMYEYVQTGYEAMSAGDTQGYVRGLGKPIVDGDPFADELKLAAQSWAYGPITFGDETCFHAGYREWKRLLERGLARWDNGTGN